MRNEEKDARDAAARRKKLIDVAFALFSRKSIEAVTLDEIAREAGVGIATLYRYFTNKPNLVIEIGAGLWLDYYKEVEKEYAERGGEKMTAAEELEFFIDCLIELYRNHKDVLVFNRNFDTYVKHEGCTKEQMAPYNNAVSVFARKFHTVYSKAGSDGTLNIRISERKLFVNTLYIIISVASKYAEGLVYPADYHQDMTEELYMLKRMILDAYAAK